MEKKILKRLDGMIAKHELRLAKIGAWRGVVPEELSTQVNRLEGGLYAIREGVHGFMKARELGFPLDGLDSYFDSIESVANQIDVSLVETIEKVRVFMKRRSK